jgi:hypothetical protein
MLNYTNFWPALGLTIGVAVLVTAALCLLVATFSPGWFRSRHQPAVTPVERSGRGHHGHREPKAA